jgi:hypothetical protein
MHGETGPIMMAGFEETYGGQEGVVTLSCKVPRFVEYCFFHGHPNSEKTEVSISKCFRTPQGDHLDIAKYDESSELHLHIGAVLASFSTPSCILYLLFSFFPLPPRRGATAGSPIKQAWTHLCLGRLATRTKSVRPLALSTQSTRVLRLTLPSTHILGRRMVYAAHRSAASRLVSPTYSLHSD